MHCQIMFPSDTVTNCQNFAHKTPGSHWEIQSLRLAIKGTCFCWIELIKSQGVQFGTSQRVVVYTMQPRFYLFTFKKIKLENTT